MSDEEELHVDDPEWRAARRKEYRERVGSRTGMKSMSQVLSIRARARLEDIRRNPPPPETYTCLYCGDGKFILRPNGLEPCPRCALIPPATSGDAVADALHLDRMYRTTSFADYEVTSERQRIALGRAHEWVASAPLQRPLCAILGPVGSGKTFLAICMLREALEKHGMLGRFWVVADVFDRIRSTFDSSEGESTVDVQNMFRRIPLLVLDDYGKQSETDWAKEKFFGILDYRFRNLLGTIITSELSLDRLPAYMRSRLSDVVYSRVINLRGEDDQRLTHRLRAEYD